jgi:hypothetical protein
MIAKQLLHELRRKGYEPWLEDGDLFLPEDAPQWVLQAAREHKPALKAILKYEYDVSRAHELERSIDEYGEEERLTEYEELLATFAETERTLRAYGCSPRDFAELFERRASHGE